MNVILDLYTPMFCILLCIGSGIGWLLWKQCKWQIRYWLTILIERLERNLQDIERIKADLDVLIAHPPKEIDAKKFAELVERTRKAISAKNYHELKRFVSLYVSKIIVRNDDITVVVSYNQIVILVGGDEGNRLALPFFRNGNYGVVAVETGDKQQSTGLLHLNGFDSHFTNKRTRLTGGFFYWWR